MSQVPMHRNLLATPQQACSELRCASLRGDKALGDEAAFATYLGSEDGGSSSHVLGSKAGGGQKSAGMRNPWNAVGERRSVEMLRASVCDSREKVIVRGATSGKPCAMTRFDKIAAVTECPEAGVPASPVVAPIMLVELHVNVGLCCRDVEIRSTIFSRHVFNHNTKARSASPLLRYLSAPVTRPL
jgi:hypothetical protein